MTRVLRQYSKSQLEAIVAHATRKESEARQAHNELLGQVRRYMAAAAVVGLVVGGAAGAAAVWYLR